MASKRRALEELDPNVSSASRPDILSASEDAPPASKRPRPRAPPAPAPTPSPAPGDTRALVSDWLRSLIPALPVGIVGDLGDTGIRMPVASTDGRKLTWTKLAATVTGKVAEACTPTSLDDCWLVKGSPGDTSGYPCVKLSARGNVNRQRLHRVLFFWANPESLGDERHVAHRCGRGRFDHGRDTPLACVNPRHCVLATAAENLDHDLCRRSCAAWCPHRPRCIFTSAETGHLQACRNAVPLLHDCDCAQPCFPEEVEEGDDTGEVPEV